MAKHRKSWTGKDMPGPGPGTSGTRANEQVSVTSSGRPNKKQGVANKSQSMLGSAIGPTVGTKKSLAVASAYRDATPRNPVATLSRVGGSYTLPPGPRGDSPSGTSTPAHPTGNRTGEMRSAYWQTEEGKKKIKQNNARQRYNHVAPWRREAQKYA